MQSIELTQEHKDKLLEMCKALFPEYNIFYFRIDSKSSTIHPKEGYTNNNILRIGKFGKLDLSIHWFEFCMTHLSIAISKIKDYPADLIDRNEFSKTIIDNIYNQHPVDYLYSEFKKLK